MSVGTLELISFCVKLKTGVITRWVFFKERIINVFYGLRYMQYIEFVMFINTYFVLLLHVMFSDLTSHFKTSYRYFWVYVLYTCTCRRYDIELQPQ